MKLRQYILISFFVVFANGEIKSQDKKLISGSVLDAKTLEPLAFVTVALKQNLIGIVTNENGKFDLYIDNQLIEDTLVVHFFGYIAQKFALRAVNAPLSIQLEQSVLELKEVVVRPQKPEHYVRLAMQKTKLNYSSKPFETIAYYREKVIENKNLIKLDEGVFKTYYPNYTDTVKNQNQLLLFRRAENTSEVEFMDDERKKKAEKEKKSGKKDDKGLTIDFGKSFGGPQTILKSSNINQKSEGFLDTLQLKEYKYSFAKSSSNNNLEVMVIDFTSKGKVDHVRESGKIYIDMNSMAIIRHESNGELVIPAILQPIIFLYGIGVKNPDFTKEVVFQEINKKWYPQNIRYTIDIKLTNRHWFKANEHSNFEIEQAFAVNKTTVENIKPIPIDKRFDSKKEMGVQVQNSEGLTWDDMNIIKK